jgi:hypothetical protein
MGDIEVRKLFTLLNSSAQLLHQQKLSGPLLQQEVLTMEGDAKSCAKGEYPTIQCDG